MQPEKIIGRNIKTIREQKGLKLELLAKHLGITKGRASQIESGQCSGLTIMRMGKIAEFLKVDFFEVVSNKNNTLNEKHTGELKEYFDNPNGVPSELIKKVVDELINRMNK